MTSILNDSIALSTNNGSNANGGSGDGGGGGDIAIDNSSFLAASSTAMTTVHPEFWIDYLWKEATNNNTTESDSNKLVAATDARVNAIAEFAEKNNGLSIISIASGKKNTIIHLHNLSRLENEEDKTILTALTGFAASSTILEIDPSKAFGKRKTRAPSAKFILQNITNDYKGEVIPSEDNETEEFTSHLGLFIPPWLSKLIVEKKLRTAKTILVTLVAKSKQEAADKSTNLDTEESPWESTLENDIPHKDLIRHIFVWSQLASAKTLGYSISMDEKVEDHHEILKLLLSAKQTTQPTPNNQANLQLPDTLTYESDAGSKRSYLTDASDDENESLTPRTNNGSNKHPMDDHNSSQQHPKQQRTQDPSATILAINKQHNNKHPTSNLNQSTSNQANLFVPPPNDPPSNDKLTDAIMRLANMQERNYEIQSEIAQRKTDGRHSIHYTTDNMIRRLSTTDGDEPAQQLSTLAKEMLSQSKRHTAGHLLQLSLNADGISRCSFTPAFIEALCTGQLISKKAFEPSPFSPFGCAPSFEGTSFQDIDIELILSKRDSGEQLADKEKKAILDSNLVLARSASQLRRILCIFAGATSQYFGKNSDLANFTNDWKDFSDQHEDRIADISSNFDKDICTKIQFHVGQVTNDYLEEGRLRMPDQALLLTANIQTSILQNAISLQLPPFIMSFLYPKKSSGKQHEGSNSDDKNGGDKKGKLVKNEAQDRQLKCNNDFYKHVINKGVKSDSITNPKMDSGEEECLRFHYKGICNKKCYRASSHSRASGNRRKNLLDFKNQCIEIYNKEKSEDEPDFQ